MTPSVTQRARARLAVRNLITSCTACPLHVAAHPTPVPFDSPSLTPRFLILGEAPGTLEQRRQRPFIGPSGSVLRRFLRKAGLTPDDGMFLNTVCCCPYGPPPRDSINACRVHLDAQLALTRPETPLLAVGQVALDALFPGAQITPLHGAGLLFPPQHSDQPHRPVIPVYHPAFLLRYPTAKPAVVEAITHFHAVVSGLTPDFFRAEFCHLCKRRPDPATAWDDRLFPFCDAHRDEIRKAPGRASRRRKKVNLAAQTHLEMT